jgi:methionyl-tRNA formyltransferase
MRLLFLGSGEFGLPTLKRLRAEHDVVSVISQPDRPAGRNRQLTPTPISQYAAEVALPLLRTDNVNDASFINQVRDLSPDAAVVIAFGQKLSPEIIAALGKLAINLHASLLPRHRGAAPINWAMLKGDAVTGVSVISLAQRMDAGLIYAQSTTPIHPTETAGELHDRLSALGPDLIQRVLGDLQNNTLAGQPQDESLATRAPKLSKDDAWVDFDADAFAVAWRVHGLTPWPGVRAIWTRKSDGHAQELFIRRVAAQPDLSCFISPRHQPAPGTVLDGGRVAVRDGAVKLLELQLPGGKLLNIDNFTHGHKLAEGDVLSRVRSGE